MISEPFAESFIKLLNAAAWNQLVEEFRLQGRCAGSPLFRVAAFVRDVRCARRVLFSDSKIVTVAI